MSTNLVLQRRVEESLVIGDPATDEAVIVTVKKGNATRVTLSCVSAPRVPIYRLELLTKTPYLAEHVRKAVEELNYVKQ